MRLFMACRYSDLKFKTDIVWILFFPPKPTWRDKQWALLNLQSHAMKICHCWDGQPAISKYAIFKQIRRPFSSGAFFQPSILFQPAPGSSPYPLNLIGTQKLSFPVASPQAGGKQKAVTTFAEAQTQTCIMPVEVWIPSFCLSISFCRTLIQTAWFCSSPASPIVCIVSCLTCGGWPLGPHWLLVLSLGAGWKAGCFLCIDCTWEDSSCPRPPWPGGPTKYRAMQWPQGWPFPVLGGPLPESPGQLHMAWAPRPWQ